MNINKHNARKGFAWLLEGGDLFGRSPLRLLVVGLILQFLLGLANFPLLGLFVVLAIPALSAGVLLVLAELDQGRNVLVSGLFSSLHKIPARNNLLALGGLNLLLFLAAAMLLAGDIGALQKMNFLEQIASGELEQLNPETQRLLERIVLIAATAFAVIGTLNYLAVPLIRFHGLKLGDALLTGLRGILVNWQPFTLLFIGILIMVLALGLILILVTSIASLLVPGSEWLSLVLGMILLPVLVAVQMILYAARYRAFQSIFGLPAKPEPEVPGEILA